jgi:hypothetical protein
MTPATSPPARQARLIDNPALLRARLAALHTADRRRRRFARRAPRLKAA